jgi:mycofactocin precursor
MTRGVFVMNEELVVSPVDETQTVEEPRVLEEIVVEELSIDGVCGVY